MDKLESTADVHVVASARQSYPSIPQTPTYRGVCRKYSAGVPFCELPPRLNRRGSVFAYRRFAQVAQNGDFQRGPIRHVNRAVGEWLPCIGRVLEEYWRRGSESVGKCLLTRHLCQCLQGTQACHPLPFHPSPVTFWCPFWCPFSGPETRPEFVGLLGVFDRR